ncbi:MAG: phage portal protein [Anaerotruncus sp.]|nr:phage portal protein [Anaerotruncus sp.]
MIQMTKEQLDAAQPQQLLELVRPILQHRLQLYARYRRKQHPNEMMGAACGSNEAVAAFEYYIVTMMQGYLGAKAPVYSVRQGEHPEGYAQQYEAVIEYIRRYNDDAAAFLELVHDYLITGAAHLALFVDEQDEIRYVRLDSRQTVAIFDYALLPNQIGAVRTWEQGELAFLEVLTAEEKRIYQGDAQGFSLQVQQPLDWGRVPCVSFEQPDGLAVFEPALSQIDTYERLVGSLRDRTLYNDNPKLLIRGYGASHPLGSPERQQEDERWDAARTVFLGEGGQVDWLLKKVDYPGALSVETALAQTIAMLTGVPDRTDPVGALEQYSAAARCVFRKGYLKLWGMITERLNTHGAKFDLRDLEILMQCNPPAA